MWDYRWVASYRNGIDTHQWDDNGQERIFDHWAVTQFHFYKPGSPEPEITIKIPRGAFVEFRRERQHNDWRYLLLYQYPDDPKSVVTELDRKGVVGTYAGPSLF